MKHKSSHIFWASYADLMTALFIITLVLFVLSYKMFKDKALAFLAQQEELDSRTALLSDRELELEDLRAHLLSEKFLADSLVDELEAERSRLYVLEQEYRKLMEIEQAISKLDPQYFEYQAQYKRHILKTQVQFATGKAQIQSQYHEMLKSAGMELKALIDSLDVETNVKYMLVIEGSASKDRYERNYELSYERAMQLYELWKKQGIEFNQDIIQVIIAGSGTGGVGRVVGDEKKNQRFIIQIIPKVGTIEFADFEELKRRTEDLLEDTTYFQN
ncbi:hypothetical protein AAG747_02835 [Rapidithrix thailandica]|uniref:OmpA-like domain-containing protein n=1 Tax=Rapidithrix thailandica TaxID=413964 RepID=A0AAW9S630_9BACT